MNPLNKFERAYVAFHVYMDLPGRWPEREWDGAIKAVDQRYREYFSQTSIDDESVFELYMEIRELSEAAE